MGCAGSSEAKHDADGKPAVEGGAPPKQKEPKKKKVMGEAKLVLIGPGESGKSTVFKQMKILENEQGIDEKERARFAEIVYANIVSQMRIIVKVCFDEEVEFTHEENKANAQKLLAQAEDAPWTQETGMIIKKLWEEEEGVRVIYGERDRLFQLNDGSGYFFDNIERIMQPGYVPSQQDFLRVRIRTIGYDEAQYEYKQVLFNVLDVGGQRSERRHWKDYLDNATAILFCASLAEYDQKLREDKTVSRMQETLSLFEQVCKSPVSQSIPIILLLNKTDLFKEKLQKKPITVFFKEYRGPQTYQESADYVKQRFLQMRVNEVEIFPHFTCAVDTDSIKLVWKDVRELICKRILEALF